MKTYQFKRNFDGQVFPAVKYDGTNLDKIKEFCPHVMENWQGSGKLAIVQIEGIHELWNPDSTVWIARYQNGHFACLQPDFIEKHTIPLAE